MLQLHATPMMIVIVFKSHTKRFGTWAARHYQRRCVKVHLRARCHRMAADPLPHRGAATHHPRVHKTFAQGGRATPWGGSTPRTGAQGRAGGCATLWGGDTPHTGADGRRSKETGARWHATPKGAVAPVVRLREGRGARFGNLSAAPGFHTPLATPKTSKNHRAQGHYHCYHYYNYCVLLLLLLSLLLCLL